MIVGVAIKFGDLVASMPEPYRHHHIIHKLAQEGWYTPVKGEQGFVDNEKGFVGREDALAIAKREGQLIREGQWKELFSEDLW